MSKEVTKNPYKVMFIKDNKIIYETVPWIMAENPETAQRIAIADNPSLYSEEVRILCTPFCG